MTDVVIIGAGGAGREAYWVFLEDNADSVKWNVLGFIDDNPAFQGASLCDMPVLGDFGWLERNAGKNFQVICAVGNPPTRRRLVQRATPLGLTFCTAIHPSVRMSRWVEIGPGSIICAGNILTTQIKVGSHVIINLACTVSHDSIVGAYCNINPGCHLSGTVRLGDGVDLGTGTVVIQNKSIGDWSIIGAGAAVTANIPPYVTAVGVPCRVIKRREPEICLVAG
jgi:sugar O-acyltransferase (sialic acid O-acetyltransferase NeuD family)